MPTRTPADANTRDVSDSTFGPAAEPRRVVWVELLQRGDAKAAAAAREPWYDAAAVYEEPERWDGLA